MWKLRELESTVLASGLVDECRCIIAANGSLVLELRTASHCFVVAGLARSKRKTPLAQVLDEIRTALAVSQQYELQADRHLEISSEP